MKSTQPIIFRTPEEELARAQVQQRLENADRDTRRLEFNSENMTTDNRFAPHLPKWDKEGSAREDSISAAAICGDRGKAEDRSFVKLFDDSQKQVLRESAIPLLQTVVRGLKADGKEDTDWDTAGATLNVSLINGRTITTANIGDSRAVLVYRNKDETNFTALRLSNDYKAKYCIDENAEGYDAIEAARIAMIDGATLSHDKGFGEARLGSALITRSIGDKLSKGISSRPGFTIYTVAEQVEEAYLINCTDGMTDQLQEDDIAFLLKYHAEVLNAESNKAQAIADLLVEITAKLTPESEVLDDITVLVTTVLNKHITPEHMAPCIVGVSDGHGGKKVADHISKHFADYLKHALLENAFNAIPVVKPQSKINFAFYNPFHEVFETRQFINARTLRTSFGQKLADTFFVFAGSFFGREKNNHLGLFDYATLMIPYTLGKLFFLVDAKPGIVASAASFIVLIINLPFVAARYGTAAFLTVIAIPLIGLIQGCAWLKARALKNKIEALTGTANSSCEPSSQVTLGDYLRKNNLSLEEITANYNGTYGQFSLGFHKVLKGSCVSTRGMGRDDTFTINFSGKQEDAEAIQSLFKMNIGGISSKLNKRGYDFNLFAETNLKRRQAGTVLQGQRMAQFNTYQKRRQTK